MEEALLQLGEDNRGKFYLVDAGQEIGFMEIAIDNAVLTVYHTEVSEEYKGKGLGKILLNGLVAYARKNSLQVNPLCPYVHAQFKRHPDVFADIWKP